MSPESFSGLKSCETTFYYIIQTMLDLHHLANDPLCTCLTAKSVQYFSAVGPHTSSSPRQMFTGPKNFITKGLLFIKTVGKRLLQDAKTSVRGSTTTTLQFLLLFSMFGVKCLSVFKHNFVICSFYTLFNDDFSITESM
jgi:hypothetical protein